ncbi:MAG: hypothetical protein H6908_06205 [Hyphomicrobiales bacterium]|nr:hypothetical protein [Rickettsiales bacterium]MCP5362205.1 hypothetical protein [Hyphomicrobiales bacterium]
MSRATKWLIIAFIAGIILLLLRAGALAPAGLMSLVLFVGALTEQIIRIRMLQRANKAFDAGNNAASPKKSLSLKDALDILGLPESPLPDVQAVKQAYRKQMKRNHPDQGGSKYIASQLNAAKDTVLTEITKKS